MIKIKNNLALTVGRQGQVVGNASLWNLILISDSIVDFNLYYRGGELLFPLFVVPENGNGGNGDLFNPPKHGPEPNIAVKIFEALKENYSNKLEPRQIMSYIYAILFSNIYREKYGEFLKIDFPRIPFTTDHALFQKLAKLGDDLIELHLLKHPSLDKPVSKYNGNGNSDKIEKVIYNQKEERIYINARKYFENIAPDIWNYHIGGYQVLEKYLKDRKGQEMEAPDHYCRVATCIFMTIEVQNKIDNLFPKAEKKAISF